MEFGETRLNDCRDVSRVHIIPAGGHLFPRAAYPSPYLPAAEIERVVVDRVRAMADDADMVAEVVRQARALAGSELNALRAERSDLQRELARQRVLVVRQ